jgi:hypothetical protein
VAVLRALYGGPLECSSPSDFDSLWPVVVELGVEEWRRACEEGLRSWLEKGGGNGALEWIDVFLRHGLLREWLVEWLGVQKLRILESTKNYLQLGKMSDESLNFILLDFLKRHPEHSPVANTVLENYLNRKGHSPNNYLQPPHLAPLKALWDHHHYRFKALRLDKVNSINHLMATTSTTSPR